MSERFDIQVGSEIGRLTGVILHDPGQEVANMTPETAERALYSDILNLTVARQEYRQLRGVLEKRAQVFQVRQLLEDILANDRVKKGLVRRICEAERVSEIADDLVEREPVDLARLLIEGVPMVKDNLSRFLSPDRYSLPPLHNFFFTRDAAVAIGDRVLVSCMANPVRGREARIMEAIFDYHPRLGTGTVNPARLAGADPAVTIEGGDVLVAAPDVLVVGIGARTSCRAVDFLIERCRELGLDMQPVFCGGRDDRWLQEREQWHSGANVFALAPGQVIGYGRNAHTIEELVAAGFAAVPAADVVAGTFDLDAAGRCIVTVDGSELARGGGGCRCMTMPVGREPLGGADPVS